MVLLCHPSSAEASTGGSQVQGQSGYVTNQQQKGHLFACGPENGLMRIRHLRKTKNNKNFAFTVCILSNSLAFVGGQQFLGDGNDGASFFL